MTVSFCFYCASDLDDFSTFFNFQKFSNQLYILPVYKEFIILVPKQIIFLNLSRIELSHDMKFFFLNSVDEKLKMFIFVFRPFSFNFWDTFLTLNVPLGNIFQAKKNIIKFPLVLKKLCSLKKNVSLIKNQTLSTFF